MAGGCIVEEKRRFITTIVFFFCSCGPSGPSSHDNFAFHK